MKHLGKLFALGICLLAASPSSAVVGNDAGNGGYGIVCRTPKLEVLLLDFYEATFRKIYYSLGKHNSPEEKVQVALNRLSKIDPVRTKRYELRAAKFWDNADKIPNVVLQGKVDFVTSTIKAGCEIGLIASQKKPRFKEDKLYTISEDLWNGMDDDHRAGLMLHEIVYQDALENGQQDSVGTRYFVGLLASTQFEKLDSAGYQDVLRRTSLGEGTENEPSLWVLSPVNFSFRAGDVSQVNLTAYFHSPAGEAVRYTLSNNAPKFVGLSDLGVLTVRPTEANVGPISFGVIADTGKEKIPTTVNLNISGRPEIPTDYSWDALSSQAFNAQIQVNGGEARKTTGPAWVSVSSAGGVFGTPQALDVGSTLMSVEVREGDLTRQIQVRITVKQLSLAPVWLANPITLPDAEVNGIWMSDISQFANSPSGSTLTYSAVNLPKWMSLSTAGILSGTPTLSDAGSYNNALISATDNRGNTETTTLVGKVVAPKTK